MIAVFKRVEQRLPHGDLFEQDLAESCASVKLVAVIGAAQALLSAVCRITISGMNTVTAAISIA